MPAVESINHHVIAALAHNFVLETPKTQPADEVKADNGGLYNGGLLSAVVSLSGVAQYLLTQTHATAETNTGLTEGQSEAHARHDIHANHHIGAPHADRREQVPYAFSAEETPNQQEADVELTYESPPIGKTDPVAARVYYQVAAAQGFALAQYYYALMLLKGEGGPVDLVEAGNYFRLAAEQGYGPAQYHYIDFFEKEDPSLPGNNSAVEPYYTSISRKLSTITTLKS